MFKKFVNTSRYNKPHGILFLFYPCIWGISLSNNNISDVFFLCIIFLLGASGMRSAGCIWNDFNDKDFDKEIERTKKRDIASGKVNKREILHQRKVRQINENTNSMLNCWYSKTCG